MGVVFLSTIGLLVVISIIGTLIFSSRKEPIDGKDKVITIIIGALQAVHVLLYFTSTLAKIVEANAFIAFAICALLSVVCLLLSLWLLFPFFKFRNTIKYLFAFLAIIQVFTTIMIFLLPDMGVGPPLIQF